MKPAPQKKNKKACPFCALDQGRTSFAESANFVAVYNLAPILPGHSLVIPKRHTESLMELSDARVGEFMVFGRLVAKILIEAFKTPAFNWTIQEGAQAGQTVPHLHMHVIPRSEGDLVNPGDWYPRLKAAEEASDDGSRRRLAAQELRRITGRIRRVARKLGGE